MAKFPIEPHFRLQEWVAEEKDYFQQPLDWIAGLHELGNARYEDATLSLA
jgi:hypothetical protein